MLISLVLVLCCLSNPWYSDLAYYKLGINQYNLLNINPEFWIFIHNYSSVSKELSEPDCSCFSEITNLLDLILIAINEEGEIEAYNDYADRMLGFSTNNGKASSIFSHIHPADREIFQHTMLDALETPGIDFKKQIRTKQYPAGEDHLWNFKLSGSDRNKVMLVAEKVEPQSRLKKEFYQVYDKYQLFARYSKENIAILDTDLNIQFIMGDMPSHSGYSIDDLINKPALILIHTDDIAKVTQTLTEIIETGNPGRSEYRVVAADGSILWMESYGYLLPGNSSFREGIVIVSKDISRQHQLMDELEESKSQLQLAIEGTDMALWDWDIQSNRVKTNIRWATMLGYRANEIGNTLEEWESLVHEDDLEEVRQLLRSHLQSDSPFFEAEYRMKQKDGSYKWILDKGKVVTKDAEGNALRAVGTHQDISHRKELEQHAYQLTQNLLARNAELNKFAYVSSHNLRAPVINVESLVSMFDESTLTEHNKEIFLRLKSTSGILRSTLDDLIEAIGDAREIASDLEATRFSDLFKACCGVVLSRLKFTGIQIETDFSGAETIHYPYSDLENIFVTLISNSIKFRVPSRDLLINISTRKQNGYIVIEYQDNASGIDLDRYGDRMFGMYQQFQEDADGKGLGLFRLHSKITAMGGHIDVESEIGEGTKFSFFLKNINGMYK